MKISENTYVVEMKVLDDPEPIKSQGTIYATPEAMLEAVYKAGSHNYKAHICHFCEKPASQDEQGEYWEGHEQDCLYLQIEDYLKEIGRL